GGDRRRAGGLSVGGHDQPGNAPESRINRARARARREGLDFLKGVGVGAMWTRLESPRVCYATPGLPIGTTRASRRRQLPTNQCHAALPSPVIRVYQPDSSSTPSHRQPAADALGKSSAPSREFHGCRCRSRDRPRPDKPLDGRSFHISRGGPIARSRPPGDRPARIAAPDPRVTSRAEGSREGDLRRERQGSAEAEPATENLPSPPGAPTFLVGFGGGRDHPAWAPSGRGGGGGRTP